MKMDTSIDTHELDRVEAYCDDERTGEDDLVLKEEMIHLALLDEKLNVSILYVCNACNTQPKDTSPFKGIKSLMNHLSIEHPLTSELIIAAARHIQAKGSKCEAVNYIELQSKELVDSDIKEESFLSDGNNFENDYLEQSNSEVDAVSASEEMMVESNDTESSQVSETLPAPVETYPICKPVGRSVSRKRKMKEKMSLESKLQIDDEGVFLEKNGTKDKIQESQSNTANASLLDDHQDIENMTSKPQKRDGLGESKEKRTLVRKKPRGPSKPSRYKSIIEQHHNIMHYDSSGCAEEQCQLHFKQHFHCGSCQAYGLNDHLDGHIFMHTVPNLMRINPCIVVKYGKWVKSTTGVSKQKYVYMCTLCKEEMISDQLLAHLKKNHKDEHSLCQMPYLEQMHKLPSLLAETYCFYCSLYFTTTDQLCQHTLMVHATCGRTNTFKYRPSDDKDLEFVHICSDCNGKYAQYIQMRVHFIQRHGVDLGGQSSSSNGRFKVQCSQCGVLTQATGTMKRHINEVHKKDQGGEMEDKQVVCELCGDVCKSRRTYVQHKQRQHGKESTCQFCGATFKSYTYLYAHIRDVHHGLKSMTCDMCGLTFKDRRSYQHHVSNAHPDKLDHIFPEKCEKCGRRFREKFGLERHIDIVHEKKGGYGKPRKKRLVENDLFEEEVPYSQGVGDVIEQVGSHLVQDTVQEEGVDISIQYDYLQRLEQGQIPVFNTSGAYMQ